MATYGKNKLPFLMKLLPNLCVCVCVCTHESRESRSQGILIVSHELGGKQQIEKKVEAPKVEKHRLFYNPNSGPLKALERILILLPSQII